jgi:hypothetical protein
VPLEELLERPELVVGVGVGVTAQEGNRPLLDLLRPDLVPVPEPGRDQVLSGELLRRLEVGADGVGRFLLGPKVKVPAVNHGLELAGIEVALVAAPIFLGGSPDMQPPLGGSSISAVNIERTEHPGPLSDVSAGQRQSVVRDRIELSTFRFSGGRSYRLSYLTLAMKRKA